MSDMMTFPETWEEFEKSYGFADSEEVYTNGSRLIPSFRVKQWLDQIAQSETKQQATVSSDLIRRQDAIDAFWELDVELRLSVIDAVWDMLKSLPSAEPEKEVPRRVLWSGWKGTRYTRYKCPNCNKPVKTDDVYCHRCGQKLMFPHISHTPYIEGQKQELIVRWDDEE